jgi:hypothetical protein
MHTLLRLYVKVGRVTGPSWLDNMTRGKTYLLGGKNGRVSAEASSGHIACKHLYKFKCNPYGSLFWCL